MINPINDSMLTSNTLEGTSLHWCLPPGAGCGPFPDHQHHYGFDILLDGDPLLS